jgi:hypothetical protein
LERVAAQAGQDVPELDVTVRIGREPLIDELEPDAARVGDL